MNAIFQIIEGALMGSVGDLTLVALILFFVFFFILIWRGVDFRYALMMIAPAFVKLSSGGWLPAWVEPVTWFFVVGFGLYIAWRAFVPNY